MSINKSEVTYVTPAFSAFEKACTEHVVGHGDIIIYVYDGAIQITLAAFVRIKNRCLHILQNIPCPKD